MPKTRRFGKPGWQALCAIGPYIEICYLASYCAKIQLLAGTNDKPGLGRGLRIASGCSTLDEFKAVFRKFCTPDSIFFATKKPRARGQDVKFTVCLKDGKVVMRGSGTVSGSFTSGVNQYKRPGMRIEFKVLDTVGKILLAELNASSNVKPLPKNQAFDVPTLVNKGNITDVAPDPYAVDEMDDGSAVTRVSSDSVDGMEDYVECTLADEESPEVDDSFINDMGDDDDERTTIGSEPTGVGFEATKVPVGVVQKAKT